VGSRRECTWILGLAGFRVVTINEAESGRLITGIERRGVRLCVQRVWQTHRPGALDSTTCRSNSSSRFTPRT